MKFILIAVLVFALAACESTFEPPVVDDTPPPVVEVPPPVEPLPEPDPGTVWAPIGTCPIQVTLTTVYRMAVVRLSLGGPCEDGQLVPFVYREDLLWDDSFLVVVDGALVAGGSVHGVNEVNVAIPWAARARRFEVVDARDGTVVASVQNYRLRNPRPF